MRQSRTMATVAVLLLFLPVAMAVLPLVMSDIKSDEVVIFYPTYAYLDEDGKSWAVMVHGIVYEPEEDSIKRSVAVATIRRMLGVKKGTPQAAIFNRRARLFMVDNERRKDISIQLGPQVCRVGRSRANGHFSATLQLPLASVDRRIYNQPTQANWISFQALLRTDDHRRFVGRAQLIGPSGLSVISDIDDTIKHTQIGNRRAVLANTFLRDFQAVPGMPELYRRWARQGAVFHYVSGSPWQLYEPLSDFFQREGFPAGSFHLKQFRLNDSTAFNLLLSPEETKFRAIEPILAAYPRRRFILVGDSGEQDPEIYGKLARKYGDRIAAVLIRNVTQETADCKRFRQAFRQIEPQRWKLYTQPEALREVLRELGPGQTTAR